METKKKKMAKRVQKNWKIIIHNNVVDGRGEWNRRKVNRVYRRATLHMPDNQWSWSTPSRSSCTRRCLRKSCWPLHRRPHRSHRFRSGRRASRAMVWPCWTCTWATSSDTSPEYVKHTPHMAEHAARWAWATWALKDLRPGQYVAHSSHVYVYRRPSDRAWCSRSCTRAAYRLANRRAHLEHVMVGSSPCSRRTCFHLPILLSVGASHTSQLSVSGDGGRSSRDAHRRRRRCRCPRSAIPAAAVDAWCPVVRLVRVPFMFCVIVYYVIIVEILCS